MRCSLSTILLVVCAAGCGASPTAKPQPDHVQSKPASQITQVIETPPDEDAKPGEPPKERTEDREEPVSAQQQAIDAQRWAYLLEERQTDIAVSFDRFNVGTAERMELQQKLNKDARRLLEKFAADNKVTQHDIDTLAYLRLDNLLPVVFDAKLSLAKESGAFDLAVEVTACRHCRQRIAIAVDQAQRAQLRKNWEGEVAVQLLEKAARGEPFTARDKKYDSLLGLDIHAAVQR